VTDKGTSTAIAMTALAMTARDCSRRAASVSAPRDASDGNATYPIAETSATGSSVSVTATA
jgi:hypothetical protein